jgi:hypothetical protein
MSHSHLLSAEDAKDFLFAGKSTVTFVSPSKTRFTYKVSKLKEQHKIDKAGDDVFFVSVMTGSDNERSYSYMGTVFAKKSGEKLFKLTRKSKVTKDAMSVKAFVYVMHNMYRNSLAKGVEIWHEGNCGRCGRKLTVPASILNGIGPECIKMMK